MLSEKTYQNRKKKKVASQKHKKERAGPCKRELDASLLLTWTENATSTMLMRMVGLDRHIKS